MCTNQHPLVFVFSYPKNLRYRRSNRKREVKKLDSDGDSKQKETDCREENEEADTLSILLPLPLPLLLLTMEKTPFSGKNPNSFSTNKKFFQFFEFSPK